MSGRPDPLELDRLATVIARTSRRLPRLMVRPVLQAAADGDRAAMDQVRGWASMLPGPGLARLPIGHAGLMHTNAVGKTDLG